VENVNISEMGDGPTSTCQRLDSSQSLNCTFWWFTHPQFSDFPTPIDFREENLGSAPLEPNNQWMPCAARQIAASEERG
jgi:hypothetical protein